VFSQPRASRQAFCGTAGVYGPGLRVRPSAAAVLDAMAGAAQGQLPDRMITADSRRGPSPVKRRPSSKACLAGRCGADPGAALRKLRTRIEPVDLGGRCRLRVAGRRAGGPGRIAGWAALQASCAAWQGGGNSEGDSRSCCTPSEWVRAPWRCRKTGRFATMGRTEQAGVSSSPLLAGRDKPRPMPSCAGVARGARLAEGRRAADAGRHPVASGFARPPQRGGSCGRVGRAAR